MKNCRLTILKGVLVLLLSICSFISYGSSHYYAELIVKTSGNGKVYVTTSDDAPADNEYEDEDYDEGSTTDNPGTVNFVAYAKADPYYQFDGWYTDSECAEKKSSKNPYKDSYQTASTAGETKTHQLYAKFTPFPYTITYDYDYYDYNNNKITKLVPYNYESSITILSPNRIGYKFDYWTVYSATKGDWIKADKYYSGHIFDHRHEDVTLLAHWTEVNPGNLTISAEGLEATDNVIYDVSSMDGESVYHLVADINNLPSTILGIPAGDYFVTPKNDWSVKYNPVQAQKVTIESGVTSSLSFTFSKRTSPNNISETSRTF